MTNTLDLLRQRYGHTDGLSGAGALNPVLETIFSHRSVRAAYRHQAAPTAERRCTVSSTKSVRSGRTSRATTRS